MSIFSYHKKHFWDDKDIRRLILTALVLGVIYLAISWYEGRFV